MTSPTLYAFAVRLVTGPTRLVVQPVIAANWLDAYRHCLRQWPMDTPLRAIAVRVIPFSSAVKEPS